MADDRRFKILELATQGWSLIERNAQNLTKAECDKKLVEFQNAGVAPDRIKVVLQDDARYPTEDPDRDRGWVPPDS